MLRLLCSFGLIFFLWININPAFAQISRYPIEANLQLTPPYSVYLSDYPQASTPLIRLNLLLKDQEKFNYQVKLRLRIENIEGLVVKTRPGFVPNPIYLEPNVMASLTGADMSSYFNLNNLEITGSGSAAVRRSGKLPEGIYTFTIEVLDYTRNQQVSNSAESMAWIIMGQPPLPLNPLENEKLEVFDIQRVRLTWAPQHQSLPTMGRIKYRVKVVELPTPQTNSNNAMLSIPPIVNQETYDTWFDLDFNAVTLIPGKHYAWQIIAEDEDGNSRFKNGGKSPVQRFQYGEICVGPTNLKAEALDSKRLKISWDANTGNTKYKVRYKEDEEDAEWFSSSEVFVSSTTLNNLKPNTKYLYQIQGYCNVVPSDYSQTYSITTDEQSQSDFMCGAPPEQWGLDNTEPLLDLQEGDEFFAADFNIKVTKLTATGGSYSGEGLVVIPMMNHMKIKVGYTNIKLNTDYRLIEGTVNVIGGVVQLLDDATKDKIYGIVEDINEVFDQAESGLQDASDISNTISGITETIEDIQNGDDLPDEVQDAIDQAQGKLAEATEALSNGDVDEALDLAKEAADILAEGLGEAGNQPNTPPPGPDGENTVPLSDLEPLLVTFKKHPQQKFGFDPPRDNYPLVNYPQKEVLGENYRLAYKAVSAAQPENILADFEGGEEEGTYIGYRTSYMTTTKQGEATEEGQNLTVLGIGDGQDDELYAFMKVTNSEGEEEEVETGAMKIASYQPKSKTLKIVPVNGNTYPYSSAALQNQLNEIYGQAVVQWNVELTSNWEVSGWDENNNNQLDNGGNGLLANYPKEMRNILSAYGNEVGFLEDTYYIFLVDNAENSGRTAYMPRKKQAGFVFLDQYNSETPLVTTIAHELGHGAFRLEHTFADGIVPKNSTDNLMDYDGGTFLHKYQWDLIHDPVSMLTLLDGDEDGAYDISEEIYQKILQEVRCAYLDGKTTLTSSFFSRLPEERPTFDVNSLSLGSVTLNDVDMYFEAEYPNYQETSLPATIEVTYKNPSFGSDYYEYKIGRLYINTDEESPELINYLQSTEQQVRDDLAAVLSNIDLTNSNISSDSFDDLFAVASCATRFLSAEQRISLIQLIIKEKTLLEEDYEDLILDILMTTPVSDAKAVYDDIMDESSGLLENLIGGMDNIEAGFGDSESNFDRLSNEVYTLFQHAYPDQTTDFSQNFIVPVDESYGALCRYLAEVDRDGFSFTISGRKKTKIERTVNGYPGANSVYGNQTAAYTTDCGYVEDQEPITVRMDEIVSVVFEEDLLRGNEVRRYKMPAFVYFQIIEAERNRKLYEGLDAAWMALGIITPVDEFYILTKALSLGKTAAYTVNLRKLKSLLRSEKLVLRADDYDELLDLSRGVLDNVGDFVVKLDFPNHPRIDGLTEDLKYYISSKGWDDDILTKLDSDLSNTSLKSSLEGDLVLLDNWKIINEVDANISSNVAYVKYVDEYFAKFANRSVDDFKTTASLFDNPQDYFTILPDIIDGNKIHGVDFNYYKATSGSGGRINFDEYSFYLFKQKEWGNLYEFYKSNNLNINLKTGNPWPPANGGFDLIKDFKLEVGDKFDRFGNPLDFWDGTGIPPFGGTFTSPIENGNPFTFNQRSLDGSLGDYDFYYEIEVLRELPFGGEKSKVIPWFGKEGNGLQVNWNIPKDGQFPKTWNQLVEEGYVKVTIKSSPSGGFSDSPLINTDL